MTDSDLRHIAHVATLLRPAQRVLFVTGAGISADSGLPTYRGIGGLYEGRLSADGLPIEEVLSGGMLRTRPELTWKYLLEIENACRGAEPNEGHRVIARLEEGRDSVLVLTQNVDGLHRRAGSHDVLEIHGRFSDLYCVACPYRVAVEDYSELDPVPRCPQCGALVRPDVVLFGEMLPEATVNRFLTELERGFDVVFSVGTSAGFHYIAQPVVAAHRTGIPTVEINPGDTDISALVDYKITAGAAEALGALWRELGR